VFENTSAGLLTPCSSLNPSGAFDVSHRSKTPTATYARLSVCLSRSFALPHSIFTAFFLVCSCGLVWRLLFFAFPHFFLHLNFWRPYGGLRPTENGPGSLTPPPFAVLTCIYWFKKEVDPDRRRAFLLGLGARVFESFFRRPCPAPSVN